MKQLEIAVSTIEAAILAAKAGAHRIELCDNLGEGGTTPSFGTIQYTTDNITIPVHPIIRPRGGDFLYTQAEKKVILYDVSICKNLNCKGIVVGALLQNGGIDEFFLKQIIKEAGSMQITFHRAFDRCKNAIDALQILINNGVQTLLTSGQMLNALQGAGLIKKLIAKAENKINIMPGAGVRASNLQEIINATGATFYHSSAGVNANSNMQYFNNFLDINKPAYLHTSELEIKNMLQILNNN